MGSATKRRNSHYSSASSKRSRWDGGTMIRALVPRPGRVCAHGSCRWLLPAELELLGCGSQRDDQIRLHNLAFARRSRATVGTILHRQHPLGASASSSTKPRGTRVMSIGLNSSNMRVSWAASPQSSAHDRVPDGYRPRSASQLSTKNESLRPTWVSVRSACGVPRKLSQAVLLIIISRGRLSIAGNICHSTDSDS